MFTFLLVVLPAEDMESIGKERRKAASEKAQARHERRKLSEDREQLYTERQRLNRERRELAQERERLRHLQQGGSEQQGQHRASGEQWPQGRSQVHTRQEEVVSCCPRQTPKHGGSMHAIADKDYYCRPRIMLHCASAVLTYGPGGPAALAAVA